MSTVLVYNLNFGQNDHVKIISTKTNSVINGTVYTIHGDAARFEIKEQFNTVMESMDSSLVGIKRYEIDTISASEDYFCWYLCYTPQPAGSIPLWKADDSLRMYINDTVDLFTVYLRPNGMLGSACYRYVWQPENDPNDSSWVDICFDILTVGVEQADQKESVRYYPNPASDQLNIEISTALVSDEAILEIFDLMGRRVFTNKLKQGNNQVRLPETLHNGPYVIRILNNEAVLLYDRIEIVK